MSAFKPFSMGFLMMASVLLQLFSPIMSASYMPQYLDYSSPKKVSEDLNSRSQHLSRAVIGHAFSFAGQAGPSAEWHIKKANELTSASDNIRQKAIKVNKLAKQLDTNTVAGKQPLPRARTRSQTRKMTSPY